MLEGTDCLADLTPAQRDAVTHFEGPLLILAGAGSGKTRVLTRRVAYLMQQGVRPDHILAVTFTNKAAGEMRERIWQLLPAGQKIDHSGVTVPPHRFLRISTFHSFGVYLLRRYAERVGLERNFTIYDQADRTRLIKAVLDSAAVDTTRFTPERIEAAISRAKNQLLRPEGFAAQAHDFFGQTVANVYPVYEKRLREANALDFDDLLLWPALALKNDPELRAELDARFRFVLIDEYQDTNVAQYAIVRSLSIDYPNLCVVGDPDQSIYRFRGSDIRNILDFERDFPDARVITLERNYRSTKAILRAASGLIAHNRQRKPKALTTLNPEGRPVSVLTFASSQDEAEGVAERLRQAVEKDGRRYRDFAIFLRINALSRALETAFLKHQVPYQVIKGLAFFDRKENRDIVAYLRLLVNPRDDLSFLRIVNEPARGIGKVSLEHLRSYAGQRELSLLAAAGEVGRIADLRGKAAKGLDEFGRLMRNLAALRDAAPEEVIRQVLDRSGYRRMLQDSTDPEDQERLANIEELITAAKQFAAEDDTRTIADFLENITLASDVDSWDERQDCVSIMTLHSAKGLEFPVVYMLAVEQGLLPHERSLTNDEELEEERRLAFVGMTRSQQELYLCHARVREFRGQSLYAVPSMFLDELPTDEIEAVEVPGSVSGAGALDAWRNGGKAAEPGWRDAGIAPQPERGARYAPGVLVRHDAYGVGKVMDVNGYGAQLKVKVRFPRHGDKTFLAEKAKLAIVSA
jgi:DNA helicase-2/ATP-dependent DNA helicase PcrA